MAYNRHSALVYHFQCSLQSIKEQTCPKGIHFLIFQPLIPLFFYPSSKTSFIFYQDMASADTLQYNFIFPHAKKLKIIIKAKRTLEMKFKPANEKGTQTIARRKEKILKAGKEYLDIYDPLSMVLQADRKIELEQMRRLKFNASLSADHFLIGNQNQIDMISFGAVAHGFVDTDYYWSLSLKGPIQSITVDPKKSIFLLLSQSVVYFYRYNIKSKDLPTLITQMPVNQRVRFIRFLKDMLLGIFYSQRYQIYNIQNLPLIKKKLDKSYQIGREKSLLTIPPSIDNIINVFFEQPKQNKQSFILWCLQINFQGEQIRTREPYRVYDVMNYAKGKLSIQNYTKDIIFMNLKNQLMAIKNGYLIDTVNVSVNDEGEILKYIHPQTILHITKKNVEVYNFSINMAVKPEKIVLKSVDSIQIPNIPPNAFYVSVLQTLGNNFAIFFEDSDRKKFQTRGEITYYFEVSQATTLKQKISAVFESISLGSSNPQLLQEKYSMAKKMGLSEKEIYLQIWSRSGKCSLTDYQYILATRDYKTIKIEIEKKLKKESMVLREILRIEEGCLQINRQKVQAAGCSEQDLQDFTASHFLMRKLKLYKQINYVQRMSSIVVHSQDSHGQGKSLKMDVQHYYFFKNADVRSFLVDQISDMVFNLKNNAKIIRIIIRHFKFTYRLIYRELLEEIVRTAKDEIINLLNEIPQLLPYIHSDLNSEELKSGLYDGIWGEIAPEEWQGALVPEGIQNIHNRAILGQFVNSVWFKRYWLTTHDMVNRSRKQIIATNQANNSQRIYYFFISKLYQHLAHSRPFYYQALDFLQEKYQLFPAHLRNKCLLYQQLFLYYSKEQAHNPSRLNFAAFLQLDDEHLFRYFFDHEKVKKNSLLKEVKPIYEESDSNGSHIFNIGLFSYFFSDLSQISDLKFILNRINNEKTEFHQSNFGIYEVLVKSMQLKLKLGGENDIPMDQVMIYIQNIPLDRSNQIMGELMVMESIQDEAERFREMRINMSVKEIMQNCDLVVGKIIAHEVAKRGIINIVDWEQFRSESIALLVEVETVKRKIYAEGDSSFALLIYLTIILEQESMIGWIARLLEDDQLHTMYTIQEKTVQNLVLYMYKWAFSRNSSFIANEPYLIKLLQLLPEESDCRVFLQAQLHLAVLLSSPSRPLLYPLSRRSVCPSVKDIQLIFRAMEAEHILRVSPQQCHNLLRTLQSIAYGGTPRGDSLVSLHKVLEVFIVGLLQKRLYIQTVPFLYRILAIQPPVPHLGIIYVMLLVGRIAGEFNEQSRKCIFRLVAVLFFSPLELLKIIDFSINTKLTGLQQTRYLRDTLAKQGANRPNFNYQNAILSNFFCSSHKNPKTREAVESYRASLKSKREQFERRSEYDLAFSILCQAPFLLIKFIDLQRDSLHLPTFRSFLLAATSREMFHPVRSFELLKRVFAVLAISGREEKDVDGLIVTFQGKTVTDEYQLPKLNKLAKMESKFIKFAAYFAKHQVGAKKKFTNENSQKYRKKRLEKLKGIVESPNIIMSQHYELDQEEEVHDPQQQETPKELEAVHKVAQIHFQVLQQRKTILKRILPFRPFILGKEFLITEEKPELARKKSAPEKGSLGKDNNYLQIRNTMIEHLYSHRVVNKSDHNDQGQARKEDEDFLDSFSPASQLDGGSRVSRRDNSGSLVVGEEKKRETEQFVHILDAQLMEDNNIPIGDIISVEPMVSKREQNIYEALAGNLIKTYSQNRIPRFQLTALEQQLSKLGDNLSEQTSALFIQRREEFLDGLVRWLYGQNDNRCVLMKLMEELARKHPQAGLNIFFLQAYERIYSTHDKYGLDLDISSILPLSGLLVKSKDILDLFREVEPHILIKLTDQNVFKLSKLVALGFRKNIVEQEILWKFARRQMGLYLIVPQQDLAKCFEKVRSLWQKLQTMVMVQKGYQMFQGLPQSERRDFMLDSYCQSLKNKGYASAARQLKGKLAL